MLRTLTIKNFVIVDYAEIEFSRGFTVFSGETGAGKSILIDALSLALGDKTDSSVIREGSDKTEISAYFDCDETITHWLDKQAITKDDGLLLRRTIDKQGKSRAFINGTPVTLGQLRQLGEQLVDIHGQHAHQSLLKSDAQRDILDTQGHLIDLRQQVQQAWKLWQQALNTLTDVERNAAQWKEQQERLQWQAERLQTLNLQFGEWDELTQEHARLAHAQKLIDGANHALLGLDDNEHAIERSLYHIIQQLTALAAHDANLSPTIHSLNEAHIAIQDSISELNSYLGRIELDPDRLRELDERLQQAFDLARTFKTTPDQLPSLQTTIETQLSTLQAADDLEGLKAKVTEAKKHYDLLAEKLSQQRQAQATQLSDAVTQAMQTLSMGGGRFAIDIQPSTATAHGVDTISFTVAGHAGASPKPLNKVASGGELARISLALSVIASQAARVPTLIFDEVDTGIGGAVAEVVGQLLQSLGQRHQVLCVTHLPQVAAKGNTHFEVKKQTIDGTTSSAIHPLDRHARVDEIARMLGGIQLTETTRQHAREMLGS